jgi:hypothetical protein
MRSALSRHRPASLKNSKAAGAGAVSARLPISAARSRRYFEYSMTSSLGAGRPRQALQSSAVLKAREQSRPHLSSCRPGHAILLAEGIIFRCWMVWAAGIVEPSHRQVGPNVCWRHIGVHRSLSDGHCHVLHWAPWGNHHRRAQRASGAPDLVSRNHRFKRTAVEFGNGMGALGKQPARRFACGAIQPSPECKLPETWRSGSVSGRTGLFRARLRSCRGEPYCRLRAS